MGQSIQAFVTELTRVIRNTDLDDPVKFAAFRQVAEERIQSYCDQENGQIRKEMELLKLEADNAWKKYKEIQQELTRLRSLAEKVKATVDKQAEDSALWFINSTASEAYLQQELRKLHADVEQLSDYLKENK